MATKRLFWVLIFVVLAAVALGAFYLWRQRGGRGSAGPIEGSVSMKITSSEFENNGSIPGRFTCDGANINPPLAIAGTPAEAKTLALIVDDPDAAMGAWTHWTVWNIDPAVTAISENSVPSGAVEGVTDFGRPGYGGPCPPSGEHRYFFKIYALDLVLDLQAAAGVGELEKAMDGHVLDKAGLIGTYIRQR